MSLPQPPARPPLDTWSALAEPFPPEEVKERQGPGGRMLSYVDARAVAQRLDDVLSPMGWDFTWDLASGDVVKGHLVIRVGDLELVREDAGYPNSDRDEEPIKAAVSDAFKRCAVQYGVGRHLYGDNQQAHRPAQVPSSARSAAPQAGEGRHSQAPSPAPTPGDGPPLDWDALPAVAESLFHDEDVCPEHAQPWRLVPAGVSKTSGKPYDAFWTCPERGCKTRPTDAWKARNER